MKQNPHYLVFLAIFASFLILVACSEPSQHGNPAHSMKIYFLNVGQGLSVLLESHGNFALFDTGPDSMDISGTLSALGATNLEWIALSHLHRDHIGGFLELARQGSGFSFKEVFWSKDTANSIFKDSVQKLAVARAVPPQQLARNDSIPFADRHFKVLWPPREEQYGENGASLVFSMKAGQESLLLVGDLESEQEKELIEMSGVLRATILQVGHHGSSTSSSLKFLEQMSPTYAIISVGKENPYGHPTEATLKKLNFVTGDSLRVLRTDLQGTICLEWEFNVGIWPCKN